MDSIGFLKMQFPHYKSDRDGSNHCPGSSDILVAVFMHPALRSQIRRYGSDCDCNEFGKRQQNAVAVLLESMLEGAHLRKEIDRMMIRSHQPSVQCEFIRLSLPTRLTSSISMVDGSPVRLGRQPPKMFLPTQKSHNHSGQTNQAAEELKAQMKSNPAGRVRGGAANITAEVP